MLRLVALAALSLILAAAAPRDWRASVARTPAGAFVMGDLAARVKLVEYASYTCSHCAAFSRESAAGLRDRMVRGGGVSWELRHLIRDSADLAAAVLARCAGPRGFFAASEAIFARQDEWLDRAIAWQRANSARIATYPRMAQLRATADGAGLTALVQAHGLTPAATDACFADEGEVDRILAITAAAPASVTGTPAFFINGQPAPGVDWARLEPLLRARGAK